MKKVFLGVGHGGSDPGAVANGFKEKDLNLAIALACRDELERHGVQVKMSRTKDENDTLTEEIRECNAYDPDLAVDIHNNAGGGDGAEAFYQVKNQRSKTLATNVLEEVKAIGQNSRGVKTKLNSAGNDWFGFLRQNVAIAILIECAFVDTKDVQIIDTSSEQKTMGIAIAKGILKTLGIAWKPVQPAKDDFFPAKGYYGPGDQGENVKKINDFYYKVFPGYAKPLGRNAKDVLGPLYGANTKAWTQEFQRRTGLDADGYFGPLTKKMAEKYGFKA